MTSNNKYLKFDFIQKLKICINMKPNVWKFVMKRLICESLSAASSVCCRSGISGDWSAGTDRGSAVSPVFCPLAAPSSWRASPGRRRRGSGLHGRLSPAPPAGGRWTPSCSQRTAPWVSTGARLQLNDSFQTLFKKQTLLRASLSAVVFKSSLREIHSSYISH